MRTVLSLVVVFALSACSGEEQEGSPRTASEGARPPETAALPEAVVDTESDADSRVASIYRRAFERAWERAEQGQSPTSSCANVVGRAVGMLQNNATDTQVRADATAALNACYVLAMARYVDAKLAAAEGEATCLDFIRVVPVHRRSLGSFLDDVGEDKAAYDRRLNDLIGDEVREACPQSALILDSP